MLGVRRWRINHSAGTSTGQVTLRPWAPWLHATLAFHFLAGSAVLWTLSPAAIQAPVHPKAAFSEPPPACWRPGSPLPPGRPQRAPWHPASVSVTVALKALCVFTGFCPRWTMCAWTEGPEPSSPSRPQCVARSWHRASDDGPAVLRPLTRQASIVHYTVAP